MRLNLSDLPPAAQQQVKEKLARQDGATPGGALAHKPEGKKATSPTGKLSDLEMLFDGHLRMTGKDIPVPVSEYAFAKEAGRGFRFDRCWPEQKVAVELEGGVHSQGRHVRPAGFTEDCVKLNLAALLGWTVLRFTTEMLLKDPLTCLAQVRQALAKHVLSDQAALKEEADAR